MKIKKPTKEQLGWTAMTLWVPPNVRAAAAEESRKDGNRPLGPVIVKMLERAIARRKGGAV